MKNLATLFFSILLLVGCGKDTSTLESLSALHELEDITQATGRGITLTNVLVTDVVGDVTFWVSTEGSSIPVVLAGELTGDKGENEIQIRKGQIRTISGTVRLVSATPQNDPMWKLIDAQERTDIENAKVYVLADSVQ